MIIVRSIPAPSPNELNLLADYELYLFSFLAIIVIMVYLKIKFSKRRTNETNNSENQDDIKNKSYDILMQEKQVEDDTLIPFTNFSMDWIHIGFSIILLIIFFYFLS